MWNTLSSPDVIVPFCARNVEIPESRHVNLWLWRDGWVLPGATGTLHRQMAQRMSTDLLQFAVWQSDN